MIIIKNTSWCDFDYESSVDSDIVSCSVGHCMAKLNESESLLILVDGAILEIHLQIAVYDNQHGTDLIVESCPDLHEINVIHYHFSRRFTLCDLIESDRFDKSKFVEDLMSDLSKEFEKKAKDREDRNKKRKRSTYS